MNFKFLSSTLFEKDLKGLSKKYPSIKSDILQVKENLKNDPFFGTAIGKDCYKIRFAITSKGKGKRGGGRIVICVKMIGKTIYFLSVYDKSDRDDVSEKAIEIILKELGL